MNDKIKNALAQITVAGIIIGAGAAAYFQSKKEAELQMLNNELRVYGYSDFEPALDNARAMVAYERDRRAVNLEFIHIIHHNYAH